MSRLDQILDVKRQEIERLRPHARELRKAALLRNDFAACMPRLIRDPRSWP
jgi:hypothetical protein